MYNPRFIPELGTIEELRQWLNEEFKTLSQSLTETTELELRASRHEPQRPREGMIIHADGSAWDPGSGAGTYRYQGGVWVKIPETFTISDLPDGSVTNTKLADMASPSVKARGTASAGVPEDIAIGDGLSLDATSLRTKQQMSVTADGSGLLLSGDETTPGNSKYYGTDGSGNKGFNDLPSGGGLTLLSSASVGTGTTYSVTGLSGYKMFLIVMRGVSHNNGAAQSLRCAVSGDNGSSYGTAVQVSSGTVNNATPIFGCAFVDRVDQTNNQFIGMGIPTSIGGQDSSSRGPINALQFSWSAGNFDAGDIDIYGMQ